MEGAEEAEVQPAQPTAVTHCLDGEVGVWLVAVRRPGRPTVWWRFVAGPFGADGGRGLLSYDSGLSVAECGAVAAGSVEVTAIMLYTGQRQLPVYTVLPLPDLVCEVPPGVAPGELAVALTGLADGAPREEIEMGLLKRKECVGRRLTRRGEYEVRVCVDVDGDLVVCALVDPGTGGPRSGKRARIPAEEVEWLPEPVKEPEPPKERSPGRPHLSVSASLPRELAEQLEAVATRRGVSQSTVIREAVVAHLHPPGLVAGDMVVTSEGIACEVRSVPEAAPSSLGALPVPAASSETWATERARGVVESLIQGLPVTANVSGPLVDVWRWLRALEDEVRAALGGPK